MKKRYAKGTDSVDVKLTPREAVLNRNAAELLGRDAIARLNAHGNMLAKRGVDLASLPSDPTPGPSTENMLGYQYGSSDVPYNAPGLQFSNTQILPESGELQAGGSPGPRATVTYPKQPQQLPGSPQPQFPPLPFPTFPQFPIQPPMPQPQDDGSGGSTGYQMGTSNVRRDDRADLLRDAENTFYGGGQAPMPTPTPTPVQRGYQYGTEDVRRRRNAASRYTTNYSPLTTSTQGVRIGGQYGGAGATLAPEDNPAYQAAIAKGRPSRSAYTMIPTPSGGSISVPTGQIDKYTRLLNKLPAAPTGFERPTGTTAYAMGNTGTVPTGNTPYEKSYRIGYEGGAVQQPQPTLGYQIGSAIGNFSPVNFGQGLVNAASRIGQGIANVFTGGNTQAAPAPNAAPTPPPIPQQIPNPVAPTPTPTIPPNDNPYGFQYGTASVPRRYSDYY